MKLLYITTCYEPALVSARVNPDLSFQENEKAFYRLSISWADFWKKPFSERGIDFWQITTNHLALQENWAAEFDDKTKSTSFLDTVVRQAEAFNPDVLFIEDYNLELLQAIRAACRKIRLVITWTGSALAPMEWIRKVDLTLSCAPEVVGKLRAQQVKAEHFNHFFSPEILNRLPVGKSEQIPASFVGQLIPRAEFHKGRLNLVMSLLDIGLVVFAPPWSWGTHLRFVRANFASKGEISWSAYKNFLTKRRDPVFGLDMYQVLADSRVSLNVHADSSPEFASNMRLFEATGVGSCLLTDWKANLKDLFEIDSEVVTYRTGEECREKLGYLLEHPKEAAEIGRRGQARCLREHSIDHRADRMVEIIKTYLR